MPMAIDGMWTMTDDWEFVLTEPYATKLHEARMAATAGWIAALLQYLVGQCPYTADELKDSLLARCGEDMAPNEVVNEFVLEALGGDL